EMGPENEPDFMYSQFMTMDMDDAQALAAEIIRIVGEIENEAMSSDSRKKPVSGGSQSQSPEPSSHLKLSAVIPDGKNGKKNTAEVHARYVKNGNGQMELMEQ